MPVELELVVESSKGIQSVGSTSHATQPTRASVRSSFAAAATTTTEVAEDSKESSNSESGDVYDIM